MPRRGRRARFASTAALPDREVEGRSSSVTIVNGAGRKKGVLISSWCSGNSSDVSLLKLSRRRWPLSAWGYGEPQLAVTNSRSSPELRLEGGVRRYSDARPGSVGARSGGSTGDDSPSSSIVDALETGDDDVAERVRDGEARMPSCAKARGGVDGFEEYVFRGLNRGIS